MAADPIALARDLLRCPSVTPAEGGAIVYLEGVFKKAGFTTHRVTLTEDGYPPIDNLYARIGTIAPHLTFAGHTDVVPPGDEAAWTHPPFSGEVVDGVLYGRGAVDMKGGIASAAAAVLDYLSAHGGKPKGSISFIITGDEESVAVNGTVRLLPWIAAKGEKFDHCILAEPSNREALGDMVKIGRRGSVNGALTVHGKQCHVAYPDRGDNPVTGIVTLIAAIKAEPLDSGSAHFSPSNLEFTSIDVGNPTTNVIPSQASAKFNIRFNDRHSLESLKALVEARAKKAAAGHIQFTFDWKSSNANVFLVEPSPFTEKVTSAIEEATGRKPELSTSGGTSDARFIKDYCPVVEFGLVGQTMHQVNECVPTRDLVTLTAIFRKILDRYFE